MKRMILTFLLSGLSLAAADTHYVNIYSGVEVPPYTDMFQGSHTIQPAIDVAENGDTVKVMSATFDLTAQIVVTNGICLKSSGGWTSVILDGQRGGTVWTRALYISHTGAVVDGFTIRNCHPPAGSEGGGVLLSTGKLVNCWVVSNTAPLEGGGIMIRGDGEVSGCRIQENGGDMFGGGISCRNGGLVTNCVIDGNVNGWGGGAACMNGGAVVCSWVSNNIAWDRYGGGIYIYQEGLVDQCVVNCNTSEFGGGVYLDQGGLVTNSRVCANSATNAGGIYVAGGTVVDSEVLANFAAGDWPTGGRGGGVLINGVGYVRRCEIADNVAYDRGGGVAMYAQSVMENCLVRGNEAAYYGGGVECDQGGDVLYCTIVDNLAWVNGGGGLHVVDGGYIMSTIIWSNEAAYSDDVLEDGTGGFQFYYCCTTPMPSVGSENITENPQSRRATTGCSRDRPALTAGDLSICRTCEACRARSRGTRTNRRLMTAERTSTSIPRGTPTATDRRTGQRFGWEPIRRTQTHT